MARYIKANRRVAEYLHLENDRNTVTDGNYLLWQSDMLHFGPLTALNDTLEKIGGIALLPHEAREEQDGTLSRPLPTATDERFIVNTASDADEAPAEAEGQEPSPESAPASVTADDENAESEEQPTDGQADDGEVQPNNEE